MLMVACYSPDFSTEFRAFGDICSAMMEGLDWVSAHNGGLARMETLETYNGSWQVATDSGLVVIRPATEKEIEATAEWNRRQTEREAQAARDAEAAKRFSRKYR